MSPEDSGGSGSQSCQSQASCRPVTRNHDDGTNEPKSSAYSPLLLLPRALITRVAADTMTIQTQILGHTDEHVIDASQNVRFILGYLSDLEFSSLCAGLSAAGPGEIGAVC